MRTIKAWGARGGRLLMLAAIVVAFSGCATLGEVIRAGVWIAAIQLAVVSLLASRVIATVRSAEGGNPAGERFMATKDRDRTSRR